MKFEEIKRLINLCKYEDDLFLSGYRSIAGVDEVGRGSLAGPLMAAAVILDRENLMIEGLNDSKKVSIKKRECIYKKIINSCISWSVAKVSSREIDKISINNANILAVKKAANKLKVKPDAVLVDYICVDLDAEVLPIVNGDELSASIAAASVIAKVTREKIMVELSKYYPEYGFERNKGYGTKEHLEALRIYGPSAVHTGCLLMGLLQIQKND
jgi:ribonuclease HII